MPGGPSSDKNIPFEHEFVILHSTAGENLFWFQNIICFPQFHICLPRFEITPSVNLICGCKLPSFFPQRRFPASHCCMLIKPGSVSVAWLTLTGERWLVDSARFAKQVHVWVLFFSRSAYLCMLLYRHRQVRSEIIPESFMNSVLHARVPKLTHKRNTHTHRHTSLEQSKSGLSAVSLLLGFDLQQNWRK